MIIYKKNNKERKNSSIVHMRSLICKLVVNHTHFCPLFSLLFFSCCFVLLSLHYPYHIDSLVCLSHSYACIYAVRHKEKTVLAHFCKLWIEICFHTSALFHLGIINTVTDDNNSRVAYAFHSFHFSTIKNGLSHFAFSVLHVFLFDSPSSDFNITTHAHARILYDCNSSHVPSKNA